MSTLVEEEKAAEEHRKQLKEQEEMEFRMLLEAETKCSMCQYSKADDSANLHPLSCDHRVCSDCLHQHFLSHRSSELPTCPVSACSTQITHYLIKRILSPSEYDQFLQGNINQFITSTSTYITCPNEDCKYSFECLPGSITDDESTIGEEGNDGKPLTKQAKLHRANHRFRCQKVTEQL